MRRSSLARRLAQAALVAQTLVLGTCAESAATEPGREPASPPPIVPAIVAPPRPPTPPPTPSVRRPARAPAARASPADPLRPLTAAERARLGSGPHDEPLPVDTHYIQSNETRHDLFFPAIEGVGGTFVGVGSDQSFTMAAVARAELLVMIDIDRRVVDLHEVYAVLIPAAADAGALVDAFEMHAQDDTLATLRAAFEGRDPARVRQLLASHRAGRETVLRHLRRVLARTVDGAPASWLSDPAAFEHVQRLYRAGRVLVMPGDLTGSASVRSIAAATSGLGLPVRVLYLSNAEEYFEYTDAFVANILALPHDERSVVLRTIYGQSWPHADLWAYQVQPLADFAARLRDGRGRSRNRMLRIARREGAVDRDRGPTGLSRISPGAP